MKALILFLFSLNCYAVFLEGFDQFAEEIVGGGGGGGGVTFATEADINVGTANAAIDAAQYRDLAVVTMGLAAGSINMGTFAAIAAVPLRQAQYDNKNVKTIINQLLIDTAAIGTPTGLADLDNDTTIESERNADEDYLRFKTAGFDRMKIEPDGDITVDATTFVVSAVNDAVGINTTAPNAASVLDINSTTKGILVPRMTTAQRTAITTPADSLIVYDTDINDYMYYDLATTSWRNLNKVMSDIDNDTTVVLDGTGDDDTIRFNTAGTPRMALDNTGSLGLGTIPANASAILDVSSTIKGALLPRMTTAQKTGIVTPATGLIVYDTDLNTFEYWDGSAWQSLATQIYTDTGHGALSAFTTTVVGGDLQLVADTQFQFIDTSTGQKVKNIVTLPAGTTIATFAQVTANNTKYVSIKYNPANPPLNVDFVYNTQPNTIDLGKEILIAGPFSNATQITGSVNFYHYAITDSATYSLYLNGERAKIISGAGIALSDATGGFDFSVANGKTLNTLLRDPSGVVSDFTAQNTDAVTSYKYVANDPGFTAVANTSPAIVPDQYWDDVGDTFATSIGNRFTVHAILIFPGNLGNQFVGTHLTSQDYATLEDAENDVFAGKVLVGRSEGSNSAAVGGYVIIKESLTTLVGATEGSDYKIIGPLDTATLTVSGGSTLAINDLSDVDTATSPPVANDVLVWNNVDSEWQPGVPSIKLMQDADNDTKVEVVDTTPDDDNVVITTAGTAAASFLANGTNYIGDVVTNTNDEGITFHGTTLNVGIGNSAPYANSMLDVNSTTKGLTIPRLNAAEIGALGAANGTNALSDGMLVFFEDEDSLATYDPTLQIWKNLTQYLWDKDADTYVRVQDSLTVPDTDRIDFRVRGIDAMSIHPGTGIAGVKVGVNHAIAPPTTSVFDVESTTQGSRPMPSMTQAQRNSIVSPATGLRIYNTDTNRPNWFNGTTWLEVQDTTAGGGGGATFNPANTYIMDNGEGKYFDIVYNGNYFFVGGQMQSDATHQVLLGGIDGDSTAVLEGDIQVEPLYSNTAGVDTNANDITPVATISKLENTGNYQILIDGSGRLITYGGKSDSTGSTILGNCSTTATEGAIGYVVGGDVTCNTDGNGNTVPTTGWKDFAISNPYDRPLYASICAIDSADELWCWGDNFSGQLGDGTTTLRTIPTKILQYDTDGAGTLGIMPAISKVIGMKDAHISNDGRNMAVITTNGIPLVTGDGTWGANGDGGTTNNARFTVLGGDLSPSALATQEMEHAGATVVDMVHHGGFAGGYCAIRQITATSKRELYCWGYNATGQVGNGSTVLQTTPFKIDFDTITGSPNSTVLSVDATEGYWASTTVCAVVGTTLAATTGSLYCWGNNTNGQVGNGGTVNQTTPVAVVMGAGDTNSDFGKIWAGDVHGNEGSYFNTSVMCATKTSPTFRTYCWGYNPTTGGPIYNAGQAENGLLASLSGTAVVRPFMLPSLVGKDIIDLKCKPWTNEQTCLAIDSVGDIYCSAGTSTGGTACPGVDVATSIGQTFFKSTGKQLYLK